MFTLEPHINPNTVAALLAPDAGNLIPYEYAIALLENAVDNGVELRIRREVISIDKDQVTHYHIHFHICKYILNKNILYTYICGYI